MCVDIYWDADHKLIIVMCVYLQSAASVDDSSVIYSSVITFRKAVSVSPECSSLRFFIKVMFQQFWLGCGRLHFRYVTCCTEMTQWWHMMQKWDSQSWSCLFTAFIFSEFRWWCDLQLCEKNTQGCEFMTRGVTSAPSELSCEKSIIVN